MTEQRLQVLVETLPTPAAAKRFDFREAAAVWDQAHLAAVHVARRAVLAVSCAAASVSRRSGCTPLPQWSRCVASRSGESSAPFQ